MGGRVFAPGTIGGAGAETPHISEARTVSPNARQRDYSRLDLGVSQVQYKAGVRILDAKAGRHFELISNLPVVSD